MDKISKKKHLKQSAKIILTHTLTEQEIDEFFLEIMDSLKNSKPFPKFCEMYFNYTATRHKKKLKYQLQPLGRNTKANVSEEDFVIGYNQSNFKKCNNLQEMLEHVDSIEHEIGHLKYFKKYGKFSKLNAKNFYDCFRINNFTYFLNDPNIKILLKNSELKNLKDFLYAEYYLCEGEKIARKNACIFTSEFLKELKSHFISHHQDSKELDNFKSGMDTAIDFFANLKGEKSKLQKYQEIYNKTKPKAIESYEKIYSSFLHSSKPNKIFRTLIHFQKIPEFFSESKSGQLLYFAKTHNAPLYELVLYNNPFFSHNENAIKNAIHSIATQKPEYLKIIPDNYLYYYPKKYVNKLIKDTKIKIANQKIFEK